METSYRIGVDGGASKTDLVLINQSGEVVAQHVAPGCNPNVVGPDQARSTILSALGEIHRDPVTHTQLYMAGIPKFWQELAQRLTDFGQVTTEKDSLPVLELATQGSKGLVIHGGTGSFVAARDPQGDVHYAGGLGWRLGEPGSGFDLGRRTVTRGMMELQGWGPATRVGQIVKDHGESIGIQDTAELLRYFYQNPAPNKIIASLAPPVLHLATEGDEMAVSMVVESAQPLIAIATQVATRLFPETPLDEIPAGLTGPIMTHPAVVQLLLPRTPLPLRPIKDAPILGVQRLLQRA